MRVAIAGGGIGGLTLAIALREQGVEVDVFEQADELREVGAAVALSANGVRELHRLGMEDGLAAISTESSALFIRDGLSGATVAHDPLGPTYREAFGAPYYGVHRVPLLQLLADRFGPEHVHLGRSCAGVEHDDDGATLRFADGASVRADVVVGADGVHSRTRRALGLGSDAVFSGTVGYRGIVSVEELPSLPDPDAIQFWAGPGAHLLHYAIDGGRAVNFLAVVRVPGWTSDTWREDCTTADALQAFAGWHPAVTEMVGAPENGARWALHDHDPLDTWHDGRVVLLGDAAHAMLPHNGQGANTTIEDAATLAALLADADPQDPVPAIEVYEALRLPRTARVQAWTRRAADLLHARDDAGVAARDAGLSNLTHDLGWIHGHDTRVALSAQTEEAR
ncbi:FAD-dependent monooxygenase [Patulibacter minatonensis]|uniref:FAD-dependent monooxygenase n=1 Tax=Patulibacter minatonensis TaxID=298163 RepID=UPI0005649774|nr:FAD-dependent monooxygenase [Patulibacter minatonensis]